MPEHIMVDSKTPQTESDTSPQDSHSMGDDEPDFSTIPSILQRGFSVVLPNISPLLDKEHSTASALARGYQHLQSSRLYNTEYKKLMVPDGASSPANEELPPPQQRPQRKSTRHSVAFGAMVGTQRGPIHLQSADLFDHFSPVQKERQLWTPQMPDVYCEGTPGLVERNPDELGLVQHDEEQLKTLHPSTFGFPFLDVVESIGDNEKRMSLDSQVRGPLRVGLVLSGGPAPGGHNVIAGLYDYIKQQHDQSQLYGFMGGLDGLFQKKYRLVNDEMMDRFRNQGGFDMLWSGRGKVSGLNDLMTAKKVCVNLDLHGLVVVGGDGSNSNAALVSEFFADQMIQCAVVGVPKTIDGDLRNTCIETSFGFDTAARTYSELIGNLCTDVLSSNRVYHFVRVMGRSASHLVMECALQTRPNLVFIGEEVKEKGTSLKEIICQIIDVILERKRLGKRYGVILVPEGLIEFIPEVDTLISELNVILSSHTSAQTLEDGRTTFDVGQLSLESREIWDFMPEAIRDQLLSDRESTGYIQVAKIATERLLIMLTESELQRRGVDLNDFSFLPHYFGYEGRCAMPSNFDANYCYSLGFTSGCLIHNKKNGYMSVVRRLDQHVSLWQPGGLPFTRIMEIKTAPDGSEFPALIRQLVDLDGPLFKVLCEARDSWKLGDVYRSPGPIQFEGLTSDMSDYTVCIPSKAELLSGSAESVELLSTAKANRKGRIVAGRTVLDYPNVLSEGQLNLLKFNPRIPPVCTDPKAKARKGTQHMPRDPYTQRQLLMYYPCLCNANHFHLYEIVSNDSRPHPIPTPEVKKTQLRVGAIILSRQSPGCINILWGLYERLKIANGKCFAFKGLLGAIVEKDFIELTDEDFEVYRNQGGVALTGRSVMHSLLSAANQKKMKERCEEMRLDGLVLIGSSLAMTEAAILSEYFLATKCTTSIIGVPASSSGDVMGDLIEMTVGFDTSSKVYANLVGNVLTEAASMPKYWHFVRLMGRSPSNEVLECALQTHPSLVLIAEEYGASGKTLADVVNDIADAVCRRADMGKNSGAILIPDGLLTHLPNMKNLMQELSKVIKKAKRLNCLDDFQELMVNLDKNNCDITALSDTCSMEGTVALELVQQIPMWSTALFRSLPRFIRRELVQLNMGEMQFSLVETEMLLAEMAKKELQKRKKNGLYSGVFAAVTHYFGYQGRSSVPSHFDAQLGYAYGHLASICVENKMTGYCCSIRGLVGGPDDWKLCVVPLNSLLSNINNQQDVHPDLEKMRSKDLPIVPSSIVRPDCKALRWMKTALSNWQRQDRFCNPGPIQFEGNASRFHNRMLFEEQAEYFSMLRHVQMFSQILSDTCNFGVDEQFLKVAFTNLHSLLTLRFFEGDLINATRPTIDPDEYEKGRTIEDNELANQSEKRYDSAILSSLPSRLFSTFTSSRTLLTPPGKCLSPTNRHAPHPLQELGRQMTSSIAETSSSGPISLPSRVNIGCGWGAAEVGCEMYPEKR